jgi:hypothetical protein
VAVDAAADPWRASVEAFRVAVATWAVADAELGEPGAEAAGR